jgi:two-component system KDP operon response regulator KdpE
MSNNKYKVLVIEDEANIRTFMGTVLETSGFSVLSADTCAMARTMFLSHNPDLVILDLGLPDGDGVDLIRFIRSGSVTPIIILSARTGEEDKVEALDLGANDYVTKPFGTGELLARVRVALRDSRRFGGFPNAVFRVRELEINYDKRSVRLGTEVIPLTQTEYNILAMLSEHAGKVLTYSTIIKEVWGYQDPGSIKRLQVNMANIRKKLGIKPGDNRYILNELGVGYRMWEENE